MIDRRSFLRRAGGLLAGAALPAASLPGSPGVRGPGGADRLDRIGLQLYTLREPLAGDLEGTLARVAAIGYEEVELAGLFGRTPRQMRRALDAAGLVAVSSHLPFERLLAGWQEELEGALALGQSYVVCPWIPEERRGADGYREVARIFERAGAAAADRGLRFAYHNHAYEFEPADGRVPYDLLLEGTSPERVAFEMDLYWIVEGGGDPLRYFRRWPGRFELIHAKDMAAGPGGAMADVGAGTIDFAAIFARREEAGIRHVFVEHDHPTHPLESARRSYEYLERLRF